jgi:hypothetical protein
MTFSSQLQAATGSGDGLVEASLGRVWQHHQKTGFVIITAWRGDQDKRANEAALKRLKADVRAAGYGFIPLEGVGQEKVDGKIVQAVEPSLLIPNKRRGVAEDCDDCGLSERGQSSADELRGLALKWGKKYDQFAVLVHDPQTGTEILKPSGGVVARASKFSPNTAAEFFSRLKGRDFTLEWWGIKYPDPPSSWMEGAARQAEGQVSIAECSDRLGDWLSEMGLR